jgi:hypothetical protein
MKGAAAVVDSSLNAPKQNSTMIGRSHHFSLDRRKYNISPRIADIHFTARHKPASCAAVTTRGIGLGRKRANAKNSYRRGGRGSLG